MSQGRKEVVENRQGLIRVTRSHFTKEVENNRLLSVKNSCDVRNLTNVRQSYEKASQNGNEDIWKSSSRICSEIQNPSTTQQDGELISPLRKVDEWEPTGKSNGEDRIPPQYGRDEEKIPPTEVEDALNLSQVSDDKDRTLLEKQNNGRILSAKKNGEGFVPPCKKQIDNQNLSKEPYAEACAQWYRQNSFVHKKVQDHY